MGVNTKKGFGSPTQQYNFKLWNSPTQHSSIIRGGFAESTIKEKSKERDVNLFEIHSKYISKLSINQFQP